MDYRLQKFLDLAVSRKVWIHIIGLAVALGLVHATGVQESGYVDGALTLATAASTAISIGIEDGIKALGPYLLKFLLGYLATDKVVVK